MLLWSSCSGLPDRQGIADDQAVLIDVAGEIGTEGRVAPADSEVLQRAALEHVLQFGVAFPFAAFAALPGDASLSVVGSLESDPGYTRELCRQDSRVRFVGAQPPERVPETLAGFDCLVVPSLWCENSPLVVHEARLSGIPVVASRLGGHVELLERGGGLLYDADDPKDLARTLLRLYREPGLLQAVVKGGTPVKDMSDHVTELTKHYRRLLHLRQSRTPPA